MAKLAKSTYPTGHSAEDFKAFGPPAMEDGQFDNCKIADMGSFSQDDKDSNKYYCAMVVQSKLNSKFYTYYEWGRVGATNPQFQMAEFGTEAEAQKEFVAQCHEKNDKRGVWSTVAGLRTLTAKPGKDVYLVRQLTTRSTGLPDAKTIKYVDPNGPKTPVVKPAGTAKATKRADPYTTKLLSDLIGGTIKYTRSVMADNSLPTQNAINQARQIIAEAQKRLVIIGGDLDLQIADRELRNYSGELYRRIPKVKTVGTPDAEWILSQNNMLMWNQDLDAFESALVGEVQLESNDVDPFQGLPLHMEWIDPKSDLGQFLYFWWPKASANKHSGIGQIKIKNAWRVDRHGDDQKFEAIQNSIFKELNNKQVSERPLFQPSERFDIDPKKREVYSVTNTALLHHGTASSSVSGILRENFRQPKELSKSLITGAMFSGGGSGIYLADDIKKSVGYTSLKGSYWSSGRGAIPGRDAFMFACDAVLGEPHVAPGPHPFTEPPKGTHCIFGMGRNHGKPRYSGVENNEWIVFKIPQVRIRYLFEFSA